MSMLKHSHYKSPSIRTRACPSLTLPQPTTKARTGPNMTSFATASRTLDDLHRGGGGG